jgi:hypothetical protein
VTLSAEVTKADDADDSANACSFDTAQLHTTDQKSFVSVLFHKPLPMGALDASSKGIDWELIDVNDGAVVHLPNVILEAPDTLSKPSTADLDTGFALNRSHVYFITALNYPGCEKGKAPILAVTIPKVPTQPATQPPASVKLGSHFAITPSKGRTDSDLYFSGLYNGSVGQSPAYTADIKVQPTWQLFDARDQRPSGALVPYLDFTASTNPKLDGNSANIGVALRLAFANSNGWLLSHIVLEPGGADQADHRFRAHAPVFRLPAYLTLPTFPSNGRLLIYLQPLTGFEAGDYAVPPGPLDYATTPKSSLDVGSIFRPFVGASLYINFLNSKAKTVFSLQTDYVRRWPIEPEPIFSENSTGKLILVGIGTQPRDYVITKIVRNLGSYFNVSLQHEYGQLPPMYTLVDHKYGVALTYQAALKKPK